MRGARIQNINKGKLRIVRGTFETTEIIKMENIDSIRAQLSSTKIDDRRKAIKTIVKENITALAAEVYNLYIVEKNKNRSWEFQCELIECIGLLHYTPAKSIMEAICKVNLEHDMITAKASGCFLRLSRVNLSDINPIKELLAYGGFDVVYGALTTMAADKMIFTYDEMSYLVDFVKSIPTKREKGYSDIRLGLVNACAGWGKHKVVTDFLNECATADYDPLRKVALNALKGKYSPGYL